MIKLFTYFNSHLHSKKLKLEISEDELLFKPSDQSIKTILDFSRAYHPTKLQSCEENDMILN